MTDWTAALCGMSSGILFTTSPVGLSPYSVGATADFIPDFPFPTLGDLEDVTSKEKTLEEALATDDPAVILERLAPYKCGFLRQAACGAPTQRPFTLRELGRYIFPNIGMYCAIDGDVYDLGRMESPSVR